MLAKDIDLSQFSLESLLTLKGMVSAKIQEITGDYDHGYFMIGNEIHNCISINIHAFMNVYIHISSFDTCILMYDNEKGYIYNLEYVGENWEDDVED